MTTIDIDDETLNLLNQLAECEHTTPSEILKRAIVETLEDWQDARIAEQAIADIESGKDTVITFEEWEQG